MRRRATTCRQTLSGLSGHEWLARLPEAEQSLAETDLCAALELAGDIQAVYEAADERTRRGYNQAFFKRIKIRARWDDEERQTVVEVVGVELTEPYAPPARREDR
jgi:hypothetical protein